MIKREFGIFLIVGIAATLIDFTVYRSLVWFQVAGIEVSKVAGFLTGTLFAYFANRFWTFNVRAHARGTVWRFATLYAGSLSVNVFINSAVLQLLPDIIMRVQIAFVLATGVSAALNFVGMKFFVFKHQHASDHI